MIRIIFFLRLRYHFMSIRLKKTDWHTSKNMHLFDFIPYRKLLLNIKLQKVSYQLRAIDKVLINIKIFEEIIILLFILFAIKLFVSNATT